MSVNDIRTTASSEDLQAIAGVGGVRAYRIIRDTDLDSIVDIANADLDVLQQVWSVGPHFARVIKGSAQGIVRASPDERRVAVVAGDGVFEDLDDEINSSDVISDALERAGVSVGPDLVVGYADDDMGGDAVEGWASYQAYRNRVGRQPFMIPWEKYARFCDPMRFVDDAFIAKHDISDISEVPSGRMPETPSLKTGIPFSVETADDVGWWMAPAERTQDLVRWAEEVVIVIDGEDMDYIMDACDYENTTYTKVFELRDGEPVARISDDPGVETREVDLSESIVGEGGPREGSPADLDDTPDGVHLNSASADEESRVSRNDLSEDDPGGSGVGSKSDRWA